MKSGITALSVFAGILFFLPFTKALTIDIFFPLKISELLLLFLLFYMLYSKKVTKADKYFVIENHYLWLFLGVIILSFLINLVWNYDYSEKLIPYRINRIGDSFIRLVYVILNIFLFFTTLRYLNKRPAALKFWIYGAIAAASYGWYLFISSFLDIPYIALPGMDENPQEGFGLIRSGTFLEGNYYGVFLLVSASIAFYLKHYKIGFFLIISIITSMSTAAIVGAFIFLCVFYYKRIFRKKVFTKFLIFLPIGIFLSILFTKTEYYSLMEQKLFSDSSKLNTENFSKVDRLLTSRIAFNIGKDNLFFGVGPAQYALHYDHYNDATSTIKNMSDWAKQYFKRKNQRPIPNNVYLEVWSEYGFFGLLFYLLFILSIFVKTLKIKEPAILGGLIALLISLNAFPSFIMLFIWVYLAIPVSIFYRKDRLQKMNRIEMKKIK
ncbi:O-antigen ligase family protein [Aquimarina rubra]|uniref:O-antigen ligase family protein n=1 Tax=Aquimarina rubra TaxID=1920033 RepID=A0ABW5LG97_9FLAO